MLQILLVLARLCYKCYLILSKAIYLPALKAWNWDPTYYGEYQIQLVCAKTSRHLINFYNSQSSTELFHL